jgi:glycosyltransferase involved in cell wall biosynthesis
MRVWLPAIRSGSGTDIFTLRLQQALSTQGIEATITWLPLWMELLPQWLRWVKIPLGMDVIHANGWVGASFAGRGVPVVITEHHLVHDPAYAPFKSRAQSAYHRWHLRDRESKALHRADAVTAVSAYVARTIEVFGCAREVRVIPNWVDTARFTPAYGPRGPGPFRLFMPGNRSRRKGSDLLPAFVEALEPGIELHCTSGLRGENDALGDGVVNLGHLSDHQLIDEYQRCDAVVSLSRYEGFGYTAVEAMACGKPFFGFRTSGLSEVVPPTAGYLAPIEDVACLASRIAALRDDPIRLAMLGQAGRLHVLNSFTEANAVAYVRTYEKVISNNTIQLTEAA